MFCGMGYINLFMMGKNLLLLLLFVFIIVKYFFDFMYSIKEINGKHFFKRCNVT